jgi:Immunity protein 40
MTALEEFNDLLASSGVSLASLGFRDIGLSRSDALRAVEVLRHTECAILGGDVYLRRGDRLEVTYDSWCTDPRPQEDHKVYLRRSWDKADAYIKNFPDFADAEVLFGIVVKE